MKKLLVLLLLSVAPCFAQTKTTVVATINAADGSLATSGTVTFTIKPTSASILYYVSGLNVIAPTKGTCGINASGVLLNLALSGPCLVWGNNVITPGNTTYDVQFFPNKLPTQLIHQMLIFGTTYSLSSPSFAPTVQINPQYQSIFTFPLAANILPAAPHVFNVGQAALPYAAGYFDNLFVSSCTGCASGSGPLIVAKVNAVGQTSAITTTTLYAVPSNGAGIYLVSVYLYTTVAGASGSVTFTVGWVDDVGTTPEFTSSTIGLDSLGSQQQDVFAVDAGASTNLTYHTTYTPGAGSQYALRIRVEYLGI